MQTLVQPDGTPRTDHEYPLSSDAGADMESAPRIAELTKLRERIDEAAANYVSIEAQAGLGMLEIALQLPEEERAQAIQLLRDVRGSLVRIEGLISASSSSQSTAALRKQLALLVEGILSADRALRTAD